jgi:CRISPR-associated protein Cas1
LWQKTVDAKCQNQAALAEHICGGPRSVVADADKNGRDSARPSVDLLTLLRETAHSRKPHKEAACAKMFWSAWGRSVNDPEFSRDHAAPGLNSLLNYGYAVLLSTVLQKLFGVGLDPTFGISHMPRERSTPLAYDLMEPFRPVVDWRVHQWVKQRPDVETWEVNKEFRKWVTAFPLERVDYLDFTLEIQGCIEGVVRGFRRAIVSKQLAMYKPWTPRNSKWAG